MATAEPCFAFRESYFDFFDKVNGDECKQILDSMKAFFTGEEMPVVNDRMVKYFIDEITSTMTTKEQYNETCAKKSNGMKKRWNKSTSEPVSTEPSRFAPPPLKEVVAYFTINLSSSESQANNFYDYFTSNGWKVGGRAPMKDWHAAARNWNRNNFNNNNNKIETQYERDVRAQQQLADDLTRHAAEQYQRELAIARGEIETGHVPLEIYYGK